MYLNIWSLLGRKELWGPVLCCPAVTLGCWLSFPRAARTQHSFTNTAPQRWKLWHLWTTNLVKPEAKRARKGCSVSRAVWESFVSINSMVSLTLLLLSETSKYGWFGSVAFCGDRNADRPRCDVWEVLPAAWGAAAGIEICRTGLPARSFQRYSWQSLSPGFPAAVSSWE